MSIQKPLHEYKIFKNFKKKNLPNSSDICSRHICLPIYYGLSGQMLKKSHQLF